MKKISMCAILLMTCLLGGAAHAQDRMYFTGMVERNPDYAANQTLLAWGPLERAIPDDITGFRLYRRTVPGDFAQIGEFQREVADLVQITDYFEEPGEQLRRQDIQEWAEQSSGGAAVGMAAYAYLHDVLSITPDSPDYNPMRLLFLARMNLDVSRSLGLAYIDRDANPPGIYEYMLTGLLGTTETLPIGKVEVDTLTEDILPSPSNFEQVYIGECSLIGKGIDDRRIHFAWDIPAEPEKMRQRILTYGYDIFRSESDLSLGPNDLRNMQIAGSFNPALAKVNRQPIIIAGKAPDSGKSGFLAIDEGNPSAFQFLERGKTYFYYLAARDLSGKYSRNSLVLEAIVPDSMPPPAPWDVRIEEIKDPLDSSIPRLQLVWDEINSANYLKKYSRSKSFVTAPSYASPSEMYYVPSGEAALPRNHREVDLDVDKYLVFRFASQEEAQSWGADSDGDIWPDEIEEASGTDKCDPLSHPAVSPHALVAQINISDMASLRTLANGEKQRFLIDTAPTPDNHVYWYRLIALDQFGNQSPLSPPVRGVLWDRTQPEPDATIQRERCTYTIEKLERCQATSDVRFAAYDGTKSGKAARAAIYEVCTLRDQKERYRYMFVMDKPLRERVAYFYLKELERYCNSLCPEREGAQGGNYIIRYYDAAGNLLASTDPFFAYLCRSETPDCFILREICRQIPGNPGETLDPGESINICVNLEPGERARIFHEINGQMSPLSTIHAPTDAISATVYCVTEDLTAIVPAGACLGVRVFSKNNVGSYIKYLNCVTIPTTTPEAPLMHSVDPIGDETNPAFAVRWAAQSEGLSAFALSQKKGDTITYETYWINTPDLKYQNGIYEVAVKLDPDTDLNTQICYKVKAIDKSLRSSPWSQYLCDEWEKEPGDHLTWPPVDETPRGADAIAYFLATPSLSQPVVVISDNLDDLMSQYGRCNFTVNDCRQTQEKGSCLQPIPFNCTGLCDQLKAANNYGKFIVYRQEETRDFIQVSPLIDTFWCYRSDKLIPGAPAMSLDTLDDPFIFLANPADTFIQPVAIRPLVEGARLIFADNYPCKRGTKIRYQVMAVDPATGEGLEVHYSNWLTVP